MLSRVAAVKAPRTHNRRRVTGSSGRRREGGESEPQRPNMSRHHFYFAVLLLFVVMMCCGTGGATTAGRNNGKSDLINIHKLQGVDLFVPRKTLVWPKEGTAAEKKLASFVSPSLVSAGGIIASFAEGHVKAQLDGSSPDVVAEYIDSAWDWTTLVDKVNQSSWGHTPCLLQRMERNFRMMRATPQQLRRSIRCFFLWKALVCPLSTIIRFRIDWT
ncbi:trans-sialidase [Trypanosoma cruzi Dm28c]|uniref:Trans-sialidase n=1 Tax=Trypanosoma cruzi Dm28c TaxID=1416333 RepID=V5CTQ9_TRYCR|nr:trans-sialidase [Trypanosoma cruzi Dm28c]